MTPTPNVPADDYRYEFPTAAPAERVVAALTDATLIAEWWTAVTRVDRRGDAIDLFMGGPAPLTITVDHVPGSGRVHWLVTACDFVPDWVGTEPTFTLRSGDDGTTTIAFRHHGLTPALECFDGCRAGWNHFMPSLERYLRTGTGLPNEPRLVTV